MNLRYEAILMLEKKGAVLDAAARLSRVLRAHHLNGGVIGGVAVFLHGHLRTTRDVNLLAKQPLEDFRSAFEADGISFDAQNREFSCDGVPVHLVPEEMISPVPKDFVEMEGITTIRLADLINMKLVSGTRNVTRAQDIADVIGLIRQHHLKADFSGRIHKSVRPEFKKLLTAIENE